MNGVNSDWATAELNKFIESTMMRNGSGGGFITTRDVTASSDDFITMQAPVVEKILDRVLTDWRTEVPDTSANNRWSRHREAALRAREVLSRDKELSENLGENAPQISAADLHPWAWSGARSLWQSAHYRSAVEDAAKKLNAETQNKVGRRDVAETDLFKQAFSLDAAAPGKARLRRMKPDDSDTYRSLQRGAMALAEGIFAGIRNPLTHEAGIELDEQVALEYLAALSILARWVDDSTVERAS